jgi:isopentenyl diphosphate isomerase/L-lactate dehydrogenase-like FMN-dependent dehydrogenase
VPTAARTLQARARQALNARAYAYVAGGAGGEVTQRANRAAFDRWAVVPRVLRDVSVRDTSVELFGRRLPAPLLLGPVGALELVHDEADLAVARAAASVGVPMVFSNQASVPMEDCAAAMGNSPRWFQLYWSTSDELVESLVGRAEAAGCDALVVTLDTTMLGWRPRDLDLGHLPFALGVLHPDDARRALDEGMDGVVVSTHGGRQVDRSIAALDALPEVVGAVAGRAPVLLDSGIRSGADVFTAVALGASAVLLGRPFAWGLALAGEEGVAQVISDVLGEFDLTLGLTGHTAVDQVSPEVLRRVG